MYTAARLPLARARACAAVLVLGSMGVPACSRRAEPPPGATKQFVGSEKCATCHQDIYTRWKGTLMANVIRDPAKDPKAPSSATSRRRIRSSRSARKTIAFTYGSKWKQRYFTRRGRRLLRLPRPMGRAGQDVAALLRRAGDRLVGGTLSRRSDAAADRSAVRRLSLRQLRHQDEDGHRVERRLREVPRPRQPARRVSGRLDDREPGEARRRPRRRRLPPVPFARSATHEAARRRLLRLAGRVSARRSAERRVDARGAPPRQGDLHPLARRQRAQEPHAGERLRARARCRSRACGAPPATTSTARSTRRTCGCPATRVCLQCHGPQLQPGPRGTIEQHTQHKATSTGSRCVACHMPAIARTVGQRERPQPHVQVHLTRHDEAARRAEPVHVVPHRSHAGLGDRGAEAVADRVTVAGGRVAMRGAFGTRPTSLESRCSSCPRPRSLRTSPVASSCARRS